jgi:nucleoside-diphosphate-sugar epimerase
VRELVEQGHEVTVFHRGESEPDLPPGVRHVHGQAAAFEEHVGDLRALRPNVVVDMLAFVAHDAARVRAFEDVAARAVVVSSADVYRAFGRVHRTEPGPPDPLPLTEDAPLREVVIDETYDKVAVERAAVADSAVPVTILRYPAVHGPGDSQHRLFGYVRRMDDGRPAILVQEGHAEWRWARGYAEDVGHALALVVETERAAGRVYNVAGRVALSQREWVSRIAEVVGWPGEIAVVPAERMPEPLRLRADFSQHFELDSTRIRAELGYAEVVDERTALERTIAWERANPPDDVELDYDAEDAALASVAPSADRATADSALRSTPASEA